MNCFSFFYVGYVIYVTYNNALQNAFSKSSPIIFAVLCSYILAIVLYN